jgi:hypothetical protein
VCLLQKVGVGIAVCPASANTLHTHEMYEYIRGVRIVMLYNQIYTGRRRRFQNAKSEVWWFVEAGKLSAWY